MRFLAVLAMLAGLAVGDQSDELKRAQQDARIARLQVLEMQEQQLHDRKVALWVETCKAADLPADPKVCQVDFGTAKVINLTAAAPKEK